ncbi:hypothetical protein BX600DRAFT_153121 [Xylariales sp. PMI_506]|nr:hypothetical protein BX600DRAFT_153121 [Xylariales sp. PMI_506]
MARMAASLLTAAVLMAGSATGAAAASLDVNSTLSLIQMVPSCAVSCVLSTLESASCSLTNITSLENCLCTNEPAQYDINVCVQQNCTSIRDQEVTFFLESQLCAGYPVESRSNQIILTAIISMSLAVVVIAGRCGARWKLTGRLWSDDYIAIFTLIFFLAFAAMEGVSAEKGFGLHHWNVNPANGPILSQLLYASKLVYVVVQCTGKIGILVMYQRVFDTGSNGVRWFRFTIWGLIAFCLVEELIYILIIALQCLPVAALWDTSITGAKCINADLAFFIGAIFNIVGDIVLIILPIPMLHKLQVSQRKRIGVAIMFAVASLGFVASIVRVKYLVEGASKFDSSWYYVGVGVWSIIELLCVVVCGSIPALRPVLAFTVEPLRSYFSGAVSTWRRSTRNTAGFSASDNSSKRRTLEKQHLFQNHSRSRSLPQDHYHYQLQLGRSSVKTEYSEMASLPRQPTKAFVNYDKPLPEIRVNDLEAGYKRPITSSDSDDDFVPRSRFST